MVTAWSHGERRREMEELSRVEQVRLSHVEVLTVQSYQSKSVLNWMLRYVAMLSRAAQVGGGSVTEGRGGEGKG